MSPLENQQTRSSKKDPEKEIWQKRSSKRDPTKKIQQKRSGKEIKQKESKQKNVIIIIIIIIIIYSWLNENEVFIIHKSKYNSYITSYKTN